MRGSAVRIAEGMLLSGSSCDAVAEALGVHRSTAYRLRLACGLPRRWFPLTSDERRQIRRLLAGNLSRRAVARMTGRGLGTVGRIGSLRRPGDSGPRRVRAAYRCPGCGYLIRIRPCVICLAGGADDRLKTAQRVA